MSVISISVIEPSPQAVLVKRIRALTGSGVAAIANALRLGTPIFEREIFDHKSEATLHLLRDLLDLLEQEGVALFVKEDAACISALVLRNIIESALQD